MQRFDKALIIGLALLVVAAPQARAASDQTQDESAQLADMYVEFGKRSYDAGLYGDAVHDFRNALKLRPGHPEALRYLRLLGEDVPAPRGAAPVPAVPPATRHDAQS